MPKLNYSILCEKPIIDARSNQLSLIGTVEQITVPVIPVVAPLLLHVVTLWEKIVSGEERFKHRISIQPAASGEEPFIQEFENIIPAENVRLRTCNGFGGIPINSEDRISFTIELFEDDNWVEKHKIDVWIVKKT